MLLAAGLGERLRPLTIETPKPLVQVGGKPIIEHHLEKLHAAGYSEIIINVSYLAQKIKNYLGDGQKYNVKIIYSDEGTTPLDTAGGIIHALPFLGEDPFLVMNSDIWCDHSLSFANLSSNKLAHLVLIDNPSHNSKGDFAYEYGKIYNSGKNFLTFSGIGIYRPELFINLPKTKSALAPILRTAIEDENVSAEYFTGNWFDIGTPERLKETNIFLSKLK